MIARKSRQKSAANISHARSQTAQAPSTVSAQPAARGLADGRRHVQKNRLSREAWRDQRLKSSLAARRAIVREDVEDEPPGQAAGNQQKHRRKSGITEERKPAFYPHHHGGADNQRGD